MRRAHIKWITEPAPIGSSRHELRNALSALGADRERVEATFLPYDADKKIER
jgi:hypothetical protein